MSWKSVPTWLRAADIAVNVTACVLKSSFSHFLNASGFFYQSPLPRKQAKKGDYCGVMWQSPREQLCPILSTAHRHGASAAHRAVRLLWGH